MEIGCEWLRRFRFKPASVASTSSLAPPTVSSLSSPTYREPISVIFSAKPSPNLLRVLFSRWRSLSTAVSPSPLSDPGFEFQEAVERRTEAPTKSSKVLLKGMSYTELEKWVQLRGFRTGQALMLWKRLYGGNIWAHESDEFEGLNKDFKAMLSENAEFKALSLKEIRTASDGTKKADVFVI